tara:strand:+ start:57 stop:917 length:861 start_codon:yes stop_codon:yes gene_type:complete
MENTKKDVSKGKDTKQEQIHDLIFGKEIGWQEIIYDLINTEQLNPWDIDITILTNKYMEKLGAFEEENYFVSSKVLLAAALLLRIKSEVLLNKYIKSIDEILFGKSSSDSEKLKDIEIMEFDEEIPELFPRSPMPRFKKVTLKELVESLNKAIVTEGKRIKKEIVRRDAVREASIVLPKKKYTITDKIEEISKKILDYFKKNQKEKRIAFSKISGKSKEDKIVSFIALLHLENQDKIWIEQEIYFGELYIWIKKNYLREHDPFAELRIEDEVEKIINPNMSNNNSP